MNETRLTGLENLRTRFASIGRAAQQSKPFHARHGELARSIDVAEMKTENLDGFL